MSYPATSKDLYFGLKWGADNVNRRSDNRAMIPKSSHGAFKRLVAALVKHHGTRDAMCKAIGMSSGSLWQLECNASLSTDNARRIIDGHKVISAKGVTP